MSSEPTLNLKKKIGDILTEYCHDEGLEDHLEKYQKIFKTHGLGTLKSWSKLTMENRENLTNRSIQGDYAIPITISNHLDEMTGIEPENVSFAKK